MWRTRKGRKKTGKGRKVKCRKRQRDREERENKEEAKHTHLSNHQTKRRGFVLKDNWRNPKDKSEWEKKRLEKKKWKSEMG
jgi:hypothetical protein